MIRNNIKYKWPVTGLNLNAKENIISNKCHQYKLWMNMKENNYKIL